MKVQILDNKVIGSNVKAGFYNIEPADAGTENQNRVFHALLSEYWRSGCHSYDAKNFPHFRELWKLYEGAGAEKYFDIVDESGNPCEPIIKYRVKSWRDYTKKERKDAIDNLINRMVESGVNSAKFSEILHGMENAA